MPAITSLDLSNAKLDVDHIADIATSLQPIATDRLGHTKLTMQGAVDSIKAFNPRGPRVTGTTYYLKDLYKEGGITYLVVVASFSSVSASADLASGKVVVYQGITSFDLAQETGASLIGWKTENVGYLIDQLNSLTAITTESRGAVYTEDFTKVAQGGTPQSLQVFGSASAIIGTDSLLSVVSNYTTTTAAVIMPCNFAEGKLSFVVKRGTFMIGFRTRTNGEGWRIWSGDGANIEFGFVSAARGVTATLPSFTMPGTTGDLINVEVEVGPMAQGTGVNLRAWVQGTPRSTANSRSGTFAADGTGGIPNINEGLIRIESIGSTPTLLQSITVDDGSNRTLKMLDYVTPVGRWFSRYEGGRSCLSTIRQGSSLSCRVTGTDKVSVEFKTSPGSTVAPVLAIYVNGVFNNYVTLSLTGNYADIVTGLTPTRTYKLDIFVSGIQESDPVWRKGAGVQLYRLIPYKGTISPRNEHMPKALFIGDSITAGIAAKGTPGISTPSNSCGDVSYGVLTSNKMGWDANISGFGGTGLTVSGNGGVPDVRTSSVNYMFSRANSDDNHEYIIINVGQNDGGASVPAAIFEAAYKAFVAKLQTTYPIAKIYLMSPLSQVYAANIATVATVMGCTFINTAGWLSSGDFNDGIHPTPSGHDKLSALLTLFIQNDLILNG